MGRTDLYSRVAKLWKTHSFAALTRSFKVLQRVNKSHKNPYKALFLWRNLFIVYIARIKHILQISFIFSDNISLSLSFIHAEQQKFNNDVNDRTHNKKQIRFPVQQQGDKEPTQPKIQYREFVFNTQSVKSFRLSMTALRTVQRQIRTLLTYSVCRNVPP